MDTVKTGKFLAELRREKGYTQEELGEKLGVTNKTVSRWETGAYLPPVEMLKLLGEEYSVSINELLNGQRIPEESYREKAESCFEEILSASPFSLKEKIAFRKKKWLKEHAGLIVLCALVLLALYVLGAIVNSVFFIAGALWIVISWACINNKMMTYVEKNAFDGTGLGE